MSEAPRHPVDDPRFRDARATYMTDWATLVQPYNDAAHQFVNHSVTYGSTALQAAYIINGGALAALPALLTSLTKASAASIATAAIPFILGISAAAISSLSAYLNFQWNAAVSWHDSRVTANMLRRFYDAAADDVPDPKERTTYEFWIKVSLFIGIGAAVLSLAFFCWGAWRFLDLARETAAKSPASNPPTIAAPRVPTAK